MADAAKLAMIRARVAAMEPEEIERFLKGACEENFEPGLSDADFEAFVLKCSSTAREILRSRLEQHGSPAGRARYAAVLVKLGLS